MPEKASGIDRELSKASSRAEQIEQELEVLIEQRNLHLDALRPIRDAIKALEDERSEL